MAEIDVEKVLAELNLSEKVALTAGKTLIMLQDNQLRILSYL